MENQELNELTELQLAKMYRESQDENVLTIINERIKDLYENADPYSLTNEQLVLIIHTYNDDYYWGVLYEKTKNSIHSTIHKYANGQIGADEESDASLSRRLKIERYTGKSVFQNIDAALDEIDGVIAFRTYNNGTSNPISVDAYNTMIDAHSILVIILGGDDQKIARALINNVSAGCGYTALDNATSMTIGFGGANNDQSFGTVVFNRPQDVDIYARVVARKNNYTGDDLEADIKQFLVDWSANVYQTTFENKIGDTLSVFYLANAIQTTLGCIIDELKIGTADDSLDFSEIPLKADELATFEPDNITVVIL